MSFADELRNKFLVDDANEYDSILDREQRRNKSLELLKDYVVEQVKIEAINSSRNGARFLDFAPEYHTAGVWGVSATPIGCLNSKYDMQLYDEYGYSGTLSSFVHRDDFDCFKTMIYEELSKCGFDDLFVDFFCHRERENRHFFKGKIKGWSLQIKATW